MFFPFDLVITFWLHFLFCLLYSNYPLSFHNCVCLCMFPILSIIFSQSGFFFSIFFVHVSKSLSDFHTDLFSVFAYIQFSLYPFSLSLSFFIYSLQLSLLSSFTPFIPFPFIHTIYPLFHRFTPYTPLSSLSSIYPSSIYSVDLSFSPSPPFSPQSLTSSESRMTFDPPTPVAARLLQPPVRSAAVSLSQIHDGINMLTSPVRPRSPLPFSLPFWGFLCLFF